MENLKNPSIPTIANPINLDKAIQDIQILFGNGLPWLTKSFGRARIQPRKDPVDGTIRREPMVYQGTKEYYPVLPNDALNAFSFMRLRGSRDFDDVGDANYAMFETAPVDAIFWVNLEAIDKTKDYIYTDELINDVIVLLKLYPSTELIRILDEDAREIFKGYTLKEEQRDLLMYPFAAWRIEMNLQYENFCQ